MRKSSVLLIFTVAITTLLLTIIPFNDSNNVFVHFIWFAVLTTALFWFAKLCVYLLHDQKAKIISPIANRPRKTEILTTSAIVTTIVLMFIPLPAGKLKPESIGFLALGAAILITITDVVARILVEIFHKPRLALLSNIAQMPRNREEVLLGAFFSAVALLFIPLGRTVDIPVFIIVLAALIAFASVAAGILYRGFIDVDRPRTRLIWILLLNVVYLFIFPKTGLIIVAALIVALYITLLLLKYASIKKQVRAIKQRQGGN